MCMPMRAWVYACVFTCPCVSMWTCVMWTSQVKGRCLPPSLAWHLLFETKSPLESGAHWSVSWALGPRGSSCLLLPCPPCQGCVTATHRQVWLLLGAGITLWPSCFCSKQFVYLLSHLISPALWVLTMNGVHHPSPRVVGLSSGLSQWLYFPWWDIEAGLALPGVFSSGRSLAFLFPSPWTHSLTYSYFSKPVASFSYLTEMPVTRTFFLLVPPAGQF